MSYVLYKFDKFFYNIFYERWVKEMEELVAKAKNGDDDAFAKLVLSVKSDLYKMARARINNEQDIEDVILITEYKAYRNLHKLNHDKYFKTWIIRILINECNKFYQEKKRNQNIMERYIENHDFTESDFDESDINIDDLKKLLTDKEREMFELHYIDHLTTKQISQLKNINENTVKGRFKNGRDRIKSKYSTIVITILVVFIVATGAVFGKDIINYILSLFNLKSVGYNNENVLDAIENKEWVQNVEMDYIDLNDEYSIKVDYLLFDDINLYMIFDLKSKSGFGENNRFDIRNLNIKNENDIILADNSEWKPKQLSLITGLKNIQSTNNNIREMIYMISNGYPNMNKLTVSFDSIIIYDNSKNYNEYISGKNIINVNNISFEIKLDDRFINKSSINYEINNQSQDIPFEVERALYSDTGFYAIIKTNESNLKIMLEDSNNKTYNCNRVLVKASIKDNIYYYLINSNIPSRSRESITLRDKNDNSKIIKLKIY